MNLFFKYIANNRVKAFTLLEVLASLSIVTLVILGPLTFSINSASYSSQSKDVMTSMYLAQEAIELLHYQYDSLYIACANDKHACDPVSFPSFTGESSGGKAWRLFKTRLSTAPVSCFSLTGCSYDFLDFLDTTSLIPPTTYDPTDASGPCPNISMVSNITPDIRNYYVCSGITMGSPRLLDTLVSSVKKTSYARSIVIKSIPTFSEVNPPILPVNLDLYHDDLLITASVSFRRSNGVIRTIKVTDFLHARS